MNINFLINKDNKQFSWDEISREERLFCSMLYHNLKDKTVRDKFIGVLREAQPPIEGLEINNAKLEIPLGSEWDVGYEVCFYRDLLKAYNGSSISDYNQFGMRDIMGENQFYDFRGSNLNSMLIDRTFDICLFSDDHIVIIGVKSQGGIKINNYRDFLLDKLFIKLFYERTITNAKPPQVHQVILTSSKYYESEEFTRKRGVGKEIVEDMNDNSKYSVDTLLSWKQLLPIFEGEDERFLIERAENIFTD